MQYVCCDFELGMLNGEINLRSILFYLFRECQFTDSSSFTQSQRVIHFKYVVKAYTNSVSQHAHM